MSRLDLLNEYKKGLRGLTMSRLDLLNEYKKGLRGLTMSRLDLLNEYKKGLVAGLLIGIFFGMILMGLYLACLNAI